MTAVFRRASCTFLLLFALGVSVAPGQTDTTFAPFVEDNFPFITTTVAANDLGPAVPDSNITIRGVTMQLGHDTYMVFDPDLLRMSLAWKGQFVSMTTMAQVSYHDPKNKNNQIPEVLGEPIAGNGIYAGWSTSPVSFEDPRPMGPKPGEVGRGPLPERMGKWKGLYVDGQEVVLSYRFGGADMYEKPGVLVDDGFRVVTRTFAVDGGDQDLVLAVAEVPDVGRVEDRGDVITVHQERVRDTVTMVGLRGRSQGVELEMIDDRYVVLRVSDAVGQEPFRVSVSRGAVGQLETFERLLDRPVTFPDFRSGGPGRWNQTVETNGTISPDTSAYVVDQLNRPLPNPWQRNVRPADIDFFSDGKAAVVTYSGDVWLVSGIDRSLDQLTWSRYASGLYGPLSIEIIDDQIHVFDRGGIRKLVDLNDDGEADYYQNVSLRPAQSIESREFAADFVYGPDENFYVAKGGALSAGPETSPAILRGFRLGARYSGTVTELNPRTNDVTIRGDGFRIPFIGVHPETGLLSASDQQGNFVPSSPLYHIGEYDYFGIPASTHRDTIPMPKPPLTWIPHSADPSGMSQVWALGAEMGPVNGSMLHLSYGRPGVFQALIDSTTQPFQGAVVPLPGQYPGPILKGNFHPHDGQLYVAGFRIYGSEAPQVGALMRLRYTGQPYLIPTKFRAGQGGVIVRFNREIDGGALNPGNFQVRRWEYKRRPDYGSPHFKLDGSTGEETLPVVDVRQSDDGHALLLTIPDMREVMQMQLDYTVRDTDGRSFSNSVYFTVNQVQPLELDGNGFPRVDRGELLAARSIQRARGDNLVEGGPVNAERGRKLFKKIGCARCHATKAEAAEDLGPTLAGVYQSTVELEDGSTVTADENYLTRSILHPSNQIVDGFEEGMPPYEGILDESQVQSLVEYIKSLGE